MKIYNVERADTIIRISFNSMVSITFEETTIDEVWEIFLKVFEDVEVNDMIIQHKVLEKPQPKKKTIVQVRSEGIIEGRDRGYKGKSKSKTLYGLDENQAKQIFLDNYENHIKK